MAHLPAWARRHLSLIVSGSLVLLIGGLGLYAGHAAGDRARDLHRSDRLALQETLAGLVEQYAYVNAAEVSAALAQDGPWSAAPDDPDNAARLERLVAGTRALDAGAVLTTSTGGRVATWSPGDRVPGAEDPGWGPLRATALGGSGALPLSGLLTSTGDPLLAMGLPVAYDDGTRGLLLGLWRARDSALQQYVAELQYGRTGHGFVADAAGLVLAGPDQAGVGRPLPAGLRDRVREGAGLAETGGPVPQITSYAAAGRTGWTALTPQDREEFEGALTRSNRLSQALVGALLLIAGGALVVMHRKREAALADAALYDELTGVHNRRGWTALAEHELQRARRQGTSRVLLFVDLDGLKQVNDQLGHREGDRAIAAAAEVLTSASRSSDLVGRLGGDEFVLLLGEDGRADVARGRVLAALAAHNRTSGAGFELRLSLGAEVWFPTAETTLAELVRRADAEMYVDKRSRPQRAIGVVLPQPRAAERAVTTR